MLLVGHGSHLSPASSLPVHSLAEEVRRVAPGVEVRVAFWKEEPLLHHAFDLVEAGRVFVVPVFTSEGYFTETVLPRELGLTGATSEIEGRRVRYCPPVGTHPSMARIVLARADEVAPKARGAAPTLVIVGHGTDRHPGSAETTLALVRAVRASGRFARVEAAFLDQDPTLDDVLASVGGKGPAPALPPPTTAAPGTRAPGTPESTPAPADAPPPVVVVPFFISEGWHAGTTIPRDLGASAAGDLEPPGGTEGEPEPTGGLAYARAVGTHPLMAEVVLDLIADAATEAIEATERPISSAPVAPVTENAPPPPLARRARDDFLAWIREAGSAGREFLETAVWETPDGGFEIRHRHDRAASPKGLATFEDPNDGGAIARTTDDGAYRPLSTTPDLRRGWRIAGLDERGVWEAFAGLYPTAPVHWHLARRGSLPVVGFREVAGRQTGMCERVGTLEESRVRALVDRLCENGCLRLPRWRADRLPVAGVEGMVPCLTPCSVFLSEAREALDAPEGSG